MNLKLNLSPTDIDNFSKFIEKEAGIILGHSKGYLISSRLASIDFNKEYKNLDEILADVGTWSGKDLKQKLVDAMTTNETLWFRDDTPFKNLEQDIIPEIMKTNNGRIKIWSAACSTGQEPYSIAMTMFNIAKQKNDKRYENFSIIASDISSRVLDIAKSGVYDSIAMRRGMNPAIMQEFFREHNGKWEIDSKLKTRIRFISMNLIQNYPFDISDLDIVFLRNVLIYFDPETKESIIRRAHERMKKGAYLILGGAEQVKGMRDLFDVIHCTRGVIYRAK